MSSYPAASHYTYKYKKQRMINIMQETSEANYKFK